MIALKIDVTKIEKERMFRSAKTGSVYLDAVAIETPNSEYGDYMIVQEVTKEERLDGVKGPILGNGKILGKQQAAPKPERREVDLDDDNVPF